MITDSGEHQFFCNPFMWNEDIDRIVQFLYQQDGPVGNSDDGRLPVLDMLIDVFGGISMPSDEPSDDEDSDSTADGSPLQAA